MPDWRDAVRPTATGIRLLLEVTAGAKQARFPDGFNSWREGRIGIRVREPAVDNRANAAVCAAAAALFGVASTHVRLTAGASDSRKAVDVDGVSVEGALRLLADGLEDP